MRFAINLTFSNANMDEADGAAQLKGWGPVQTFVTMQDTAKSERESRV